MEPFTLTIWLWMGMRFEETRMEGLGRTECIELQLRVEGAHAHARGKCAGTGKAPMMICGWGCCAFISPGGVLRCL